ncbi:MAG: c-type cytochrome [Mariprofundaceae bacterium]
MKARYWLLLSAPLALAACQASEAPAPQSTAPVTQSAAPASNAVEVKKPAVSQTARAMQESLNQAKEQSAAAVAELAAPTSDAPAAAQARVAEPVAAVKKAAPAAPVKAAPVEAAPVTTPKPAAPAKVEVAIGDAGKGAGVARKCKACHNFDARKKVGPGLAGIFGRKAGAMPDMKYSAALKAGGWSWDAEHLAAWVCNSKQAIKNFSGNAGAKTKMGNQRICDPARQADLIAYLKTL